MRPCPIDLSVERAQSGTSAGRMIVAWLAVGFAAAMAAATIRYAPGGSHLSTGILWIVGCVMPTFLTVALFRRLRAAQSAHRQAVATMTERSKTVDRILEFSQTIQAAGKPEQIFDSLTLFLHHEFR